MIAFIVMHVVALTIVSILVVRLSDLQYLHSWQYDYESYVSESHNLCPEVITKESIESTRQFLIDHNVAM